jgi:hypothetical protein
MQRGGPFLVGGWAALLRLEMKKHLECEMEQILMLLAVYDASPEGWA